MKSNRLLGTAGGWGVQTVSVLALLLFAPGFCGAASGEEGFDYAACILGLPRTLAVHVVRLDRDGGRVTCNGGDRARPRQPFIWDWGDGTRSRGFFPQQHQYSLRDRNYVIEVTAQYPDDRRDSVRVLVPFVPLSLLSMASSVSDAVRVVVPSRRPHLRPVRAPYGVSRTLTVFDDSFFHVCSRETVEHVRTQAAKIQVDLANNDVCRSGGSFEQVLLRDPKARGMYSVWYTDPICFGVADYGFSGSIQWSSFFHEMGHNVTLNSPADFHWGFRQDLRVEFRDLGFPVDKDVFSRLAVSAGTEVGERFGPDASAHSGRPHR